MAFCFNSCYQYKMNEIVNKFLLTGSKLLPKMHLKQPKLTYSDYGSFTENKKRTQQIKL